MTAVLDLPVSSRGTITWSFFFSPSSIRPVPSLSLRRGASCRPVESVCLTEARRPVGRPRSAAPRSTIRCSDAGLLSSLLPKAFAGGLIARVR